MEEFTGHTWYITQKSLWISGMSTEQPFLVHGRWLGMFTSTFLGESFLGSIIGVKFGVSGTMVQVNISIRGLTSSCGRLFVWLLFQQNIHVGVLTVYDRQWTESATYPASWWSGSHTSSPVFNHGNDLAAWCLSKLCFWSAHADCSRWLNNDGPKPSRHQNFS